MDAASRNDAPTAAAAGPERGRCLPFWADAVNRRRLIGGLAAVALPGLAACGDDAASSTGSSVPAAGSSRLELRRGAAAWLGTPAASPVASPVPPPIAADRLTVIRDQRPRESAEPKRGGTLTLPLGPSDPVNLSPVAYRQSFQLLASVLDPLVRMDEVTLEPRPGLAERWDWNEAGTEITYRLRRDAVWHDGSPFTARDVRFSFLVARDDTDSGVRNLFALMDDIESLDDHTVRVRLTEPDGGWLFNASNQFVFQRSQYAEVWRSRPEGDRTLGGYDWTRTPPIGTGPWRFERSGEGGVELARNDAYWGGAPRFDRLLLVPDADGEDQLDAWKAGDLDIVWPLRAARLPEVRHEVGRLYAADAASVLFAAFNFANPARAIPDMLADRSLRQALTLAVDRTRYADRVFAGFVHANHAGTIAQPWAYDETVTNPERDVAAANALLDAAGFLDTDDDGVRENSAGEPLALVVIARDDARPELRQILRSVAADLPEIGVTLDLQSLPADEFRRRWQTGHDFDLIAYAYNLYAGFTDFDLYGSSWDIRVNAQGWNPGGYANLDVDQAVADALVATDPAALKDALSRLQRATNEDLFGLWFGFPQDLVLVRPDVYGFQPNKLWQTWDTRKLWREPR